MASARPMAKSRLAAYDGAVFYGDVRGYRKLPTHLSGWENLGELHPASADGGPYQRARTPVWPQNAGGRDPARGAGQVEVVKIAFARAVAAERRSPVKVTLKTWIWPGRTRSIASERVAARCMHLSYSNEHRELSRRNGSSSQPLRHLAARLPTVHAPSKAAARFYSRSRARGTRQIAKLVSWWHLISDCRESGTSGWVMCQCWLTVLFEPSIWKESFTRGKLAE